MAQSTPTSMHPVPRGGLSKYKFWYLETTRPRLRRKESPRRNFKLVCDSRISANRFH
jgi:hypothetical protein